MSAEGTGVMDAGVVEVLTGGCGRGFTVLCTIQDKDLLASLASIAGVTGLLMSIGEAPVSAGSWPAVRCAPAQGIPVRSHIVDTAVIAETVDLADVADEVRRVLVPGGDLRVLRTGTVDATTALRGAAITPLCEETGVLIARGP